MSALRRARCHVYRGLLAGALTCGVLAGLCGAVLFAMAHGLVCSTERIF